ncbi:MAG: hypothetical protein IT366_25315 [Candidatus Hydrogenedentes bacterium]|nr:hypothetical protein [Candidatus Hydrogenedentota bacterium]
MMGTTVSRWVLRGLAATIAGVFVIMLAHTGVSAGSGGGDRIRYRFTLHPPAKVDAPKGKAKYEERTSGRKKLNVEVEHIGDTTATIEVFVDNVSVGTAALSACSVEIELDTEDAETVPTMTQQSLIEVFDADTDTKLLTSAS